MRLTRLGSATSSCAGMRRKPASCGRRSSAAGEHSSFADTERCWQLSRGCRTAPSPLVRLELIADDASGDYVTTSDGKRIVDHENIQRSRLRVDAGEWAAARLAPKKYGDHVSHDVKGPGANFQPAILITVDGQPHDEFARQLAYDEDGGVLLDGNGDIVRAR